MPTAPPGGIVGGMPDYQRSLTIDADPDELFQFLSKIENLPKYFSRMTQAKNATGDEVRVKAKVPEAEPDNPEQQTVESYANFSVDADNRALHWSSAGEHDYSGELQVTPADEGATVSVSLHTEHDSEQINDGIDETLQNVAELVANRPGLQEWPAQGQPGGV